jgi:hypothetical protein
LENIPSFDTLFDRKTQEEVEQVLDSYLNEDAAEEGSSETVKYSNSVEPASSVEKAFDELMGA